MATEDGPALSYSSKAGRWVLAITVLGSGIAALDATVVNIALPVIGHEFRTGIAALQWVMTAVDHARQGIQRLVRTPDSTAAQRSP